VNPSVGVRSFFQRALLVLDSFNSEIRNAADKSISITKPIRVVFASFVLFFAADIQSCLRIASRP